MFIRKNGISLGANGPVFALTFCSAYFPIALHLAEHLAELGRAFGPSWLPPFYYPPLAIPVNVPGAYLEYHEIYHRVSG